MLQIRSVSCFGTDFTGCSEHRCSYVVVNALNCDQLHQILSNGCVGYNTDKPNGCVTDAVEHVKWFPGVRYFPACRSSRDKETPTCWLFEVLCINVHLFQALLMSRQIHRTLQALGTEALSELQAPSIFELSKTRMASLLSKFHKQSAFLDVRSDLYICAGVSYRYFNTNGGKDGHGRAWATLRSLRLWSLAPCVAVLVVVVVVVCWLLVEADPTQTWATKTRSFWPAMAVTGEASMHSISGRIWSMWCLEAPIRLSCCGACIVGLTCAILSFDLTASSGIRSSFFHNLSYSFWQVMMLIFVSVACRSVRETRDVCVLNGERDFRLFILWTWLLEASLKIIYNAEREPLVVNLEVIATLLICRRTVYRRLIWLFH